MGGTARGLSNTSGLTSARNRGSDGCGELISSFGLDGRVTLVAGKNPTVVGLITGILASGEPSYVCFDCCNVTIVAAGSGSLDPELATVKSPVSFDDPEKSFLCPSRGSAVGPPVRSTKA